MRWSVLQASMAILVAVNINQVLAAPASLPFTPHYHTAHINPAPFRRWVQAWFSASDERVRSEAMGSIDAP